MLGWRYFYTITRYLAVEYFIEFYISSDFSAHFFNHFIGGNKLYQEVTVTGLFYMAVIYSKWVESTCSFIISTLNFKAGMPGTEDLLQRKASKRTRLVKTHMFDLHDNKSFNVWYFHLQYVQKFMASFVYKVFSTLSSLFLLLEV